MSTTTRKSSAPVATREFRARAISAGLAAAGIAGSLALPVPVALAAAPAEEIYAQEAPLQLAQASVPMVALNDAANIAVVPPMAQLTSPQGLQVSVQPMRPALAKRASDALAAPAIMPAAAYCYIDLVVDLAKGISFPPAIVGTSTPRRVTVTNAGAEPKSVGPLVSTSGDFTSESNCSGTLAPGESCTIELAFAPKSSGTLAGELSITSGVGEMLAVPLVGTASAYGPTAYVWPDCIDFGSAMVGTSSFTDYVYVDNYDFLDSGTPLEISDFSMTNPAFVIDENECLGPIAPNDSCYIYMYFRPGTVGPIQGELRMRSNADPSYSYLGPVLLVGYGLAAPAGTLVRSPSGLVFGAQDVGTTSEAQVITLKNQPSMPSQRAAGTAAISEVPLSFGAPVQISSITATGDFTQTNDCGKLNVGESCRVSVTFKPTAEGERRGTVTVQSNASNPTVVTQLLGTGALPAVPAIQLSPTSTSFGNTVMGRPGEKKTITIKSIGRVDLQITNIFATGDYSATHDCPATLAPDAQCTATVGFNPIIPGNRPGALVVESNATPPVTQATLSGKGCRMFGPSGTRLSAPICN